jgi:hypothetical protein
MRRYTVAMNIHRQIITVNPNPFCMLDSLTQHVSAKQEVITRQIGLKRNYYVSCIILFNTTIIKNQQMHYYVLCLF